MLNKTLTTLSLALFFLFIIYSPVHTESEQSTQELSKPYPEIDLSDAVPYKVLEVVDGDTIKVKYGGKIEPLRFFGVDTPESVHPRKSIEAYGPQASNFLKNLLTDESVYLDFDIGEDGKPKRGKYKRILARLYRVPDKLFVNMGLIRQGYGRVDVRFKAKHKGLYLHYAYKARKVKRGLWNYEHYRRKLDKIKPEWEDITVYVAQTGEKYHTGECGSRKDTWIKVTLAEAEHDYDPCTNCEPPKAE